MAYATQDMDYAAQAMTLDPEGAWVRWTDIDLHDQFYAVTLHQRNTAWIENQSLRDTLTYIANSTLQGEVDEGAWLRDIARRALRVVDDRSREGTR